MRKCIAPAFLVMILLWTCPLSGENYTLKGDMDSAIRYELREQVTANPGVKKIILSFVVPQSFTSPTYSQEIKDFKVLFNPEPQDREEKKDKHGNMVITAT